MRWVSLLLVLVLLVVGCSTAGPSKIVKTCSNEISVAFDREFGPKDVRYVISSPGPDMLHVEITIRNVPVYARMFIIKGPLTTEFIMECVVRITKEFLESEKSKEINYEKAFMCFDFRIGTFRLYDAGENTT